MYNNLEDQVLIMQSIKDNLASEINEIKSDTKKKYSDMNEIKRMLTKMTNQKQNSLPDKKDIPKNQDLNTAFLDNNKAPPLEVGHSTKIGEIRNIKHEISSSKFYEILTKTELKYETDMDLNNFYNHIKTCLNAVTRLR